MLLSEFFRDSTGCRSETCCTDVFHCLQSRQARRDMPDPQQTMERANRIDAIQRCLERNHAYSVYWTCKLRLRYLYRSMP